MNITVRREISMGHRLLGYPGLCRNLHGHNYRIEVTIQGNPDQIGLVEDFAKVKASLKELLDKLDHAMVLVVSDPAVPFLFGGTNKLVTLTVNPSAENLSSLIFNHMQDLNYKVDHVTVWETSDGSATALGVDRKVRIEQYVPGR